ncbi:MAG: hypothetical protein Q9180_004139 [Flavoplaca navasiana]
MSSIRSPSTPSPIKRARAGPSIARLAFSPTRSPSSSLRRSNTNVSPKKQAPTCDFSTPRPFDYIPFSFGAEFEMIIRPKADKFPAAQLLSDDLPRDASSRRKLRDYSLTIRHLVADVLVRNGMPCYVYEPDDDEAPDYNKWHVVLDASLSRKHEMPDHFFPVEVVSPVIVADESWTKVIDKFWSVILEHFELRRDTTCGFHVHISTRRGNYTLEELRMMAKAVVFWEPATKRMTPWSRHDECLDFCKSNILADVPVNDVLRTDGPLRGLVTAYSNIDRCDRDAIIDYICPDKYRAWNFKPAKTGGSGSIEFRRPPGVVDAKKAKHWIAFAMTFVDMAIQFNPSALADHMAQVESLHTFSFWSVLRD